MPDVPHTLPVDGGEGPGTDPGRRAEWLVVAFRSDNPLEPPSRHRIDGVDQIIVERGAERSTARSTVGTTRTLTIRIADGSISSRHFSIVRAGDDRVLRDAGSRNGTLVNRTRREAFPITDGDIIEAGRTLFVYRRTPEPPTTEVLDTEAAVMGTLATMSPVLAWRLLLLPRLATAQVPVLLQAETGTGKELVSHALHEQSGRRGPFLAVNCGAIPASMIEAELFGHRRGAFSGAVEDRLGLVRAADGGTLLLDEIGDLPQACQAAFLRVLETKRVRPIGETREVPVDVRIVAATHRDLAAMVLAGTFRADLLARIAGYTMGIPPLRERKEDVGLLVGRFLGRAGVSFTAAAARALFQYDWPLNVRELQRCVEAALVLAAGRPVDLAHLPDGVQRACDASGSSPRQPVDELAGLTGDEQRHRAELVALLRQHDGNVSAVARTTGKARMQIQRWIKRYRIASP